jgi:O-antigen/teichoic acid export membrane protein
MASPDTIAALTPDDALASTPAPGRKFSARRAYAQTFSATAAIRFLGAISGVLAARLLGPNGRGELAVIVFAPIMLLSVGEFEFSRSVIVEAGKSHQVPPRLTSTTFWSALVLGCIEMVILALALGYFLPADKQNLVPPARWFALYLPASYVAASMLGLDQGRGRFGRFSFFQVLSGILYVLLVLAVIWPSHRATPRAFALAMLAGTLTVALVRSAADGAGILGARPDIALARKLFQRGFTFYVPSLAALALLRADMFLLVRLAPAAAIGAYAVAQAIAMGQVGVINPFIQVGFAAVAQHTEESSALTALARHFRFAQIAAIAMALFAAALTPWAIRTFFGAAFLPAVVATYFLIAASTFWGLGETLEQGLRAAAHPRLGMIASLIGLVILFAVGIPAYYSYGISGLAASVCLSQFISLAALVAFCIFYLRMPAKLFLAFDAATLREIETAVASMFRHFGVSGPRP